MNGKSKCKILKDIRKKIAEDNHIAYVTSECKYQGECSGTCPKCEAELRYLEDELNKRKNLGKTVAVAGIAAALVVGSTGCASIIPTQTGGSPPVQDRTTYQTEPTTEPTTAEPTTMEPLMGEPAIDYTEATVEAQGELSPEDYTQEFMGVPPVEEFMGDAIIENEWPW